MDKSPAASDRPPNYFRAALHDRQFVCTAEIVLGRDHAAGEAEQFVKDAAQHSLGIKVLSLTDLPGGNTTLPLLMSRGLDTAIVDPCDQQLMMNIAAAEALMGRDDRCRAFLRAYREGKLAQVA